ncbi:hypothetical protein WA026_009401 [Henosepilachna vigintioctopunctata]|uniref:Transmembrane protein 131 n=1 Tax=Henosepilachna vigintioctopunctata TaxID=420089 RepID=A0AAW1U4L7_9CUCU
MAKYSTPWYILSVGLLSLITKTHLTAHDSSDGYISSNERYFDDFSFIEREISSGLRSDYAGDNIKFQIKFDPATLDFRQRPLGVPHIKKVHLFNFDTNRSIDMTSISGSTVHFHSSFFQDKKIPPMGNTSFNVVFLGREEGYIESCLFIHTTNGHFKYNVKGVSVYSPYYLHPIVGVKLPMNATFTPLIYLHNPHSEPIQILEIYTSGGDFHLELPTGEREGPKKIWEIAPFETKAVIRVKFSAKVEQNHTAFVRIRLNITEEVLVVPLEVEVSPKGGIFAPQGYVDFGIGGSANHPKHEKLCLYNPFAKPIKLQSISARSKAIKIEYEQGVVLPSGKSKGVCVNVANITLDWRKAFKNKDSTGKITVKYRNGKGIAEIPYYLTVLEGGVSFDAEVTKYFINDKSKSLHRNFKLKNDFKSSIRILNISASEEVLKYFKIKNFKPLMLKEQEERVIFSIDLRPDVKIQNVQIDSHIELKTNVSTVAIPVLSYKGTLKLVQLFDIPLLYDGWSLMSDGRIGTWWVYNYVFQYLPFKSKDYSLDVGLISFNTRKEINFLVLNENPVNIKIRGLKTSIPLTSTTLVGCGRNDPRTALLQPSFENLRMCNQLKPGEYAILKLVVQTANNEGHVWGEIQVETDYENLSVPVQFKVAAGKLEIGPDRLVFDQCFPGKICSHPLKVHSTFNEPMIIKNIVSLPPDPRLSCRHTGHIMAHTTKIVGQLYLNPNVGCGNECYAGLHKDLYDQWLRTLMLPKSVVNFDLNLFNTFYNRFLNITSNGLKKWQNLTLRMDTSEVRSHTFKTRVKMSWPSLLFDIPDNKSVIIFPLTQLGNTSYRNFSIKNPSSHNLIVQILLDKFYPSVEVLYEGLPTTGLPVYTPPSKGDCFFFFENDYFHQTDFFEKSNFKVHPFTLPLFLKPGENRTFSVGFRGEQVGDFSSSIFFRNNLTVIEMLRLRGRSTEPMFRFGNRKPGAVQPLLFEFTDKHFKECDRENSYRYNQNVVIKRSFTTRNTGEIPIFFHSFRIDDVPCEGYGFKVLNCAPFVLPPNGSRKIDIEFTPDFTLARVVRSLILKTSCNFNVNYTLQATVPSYYIPICSGAIPRPFWELYAYYFTVTLICIKLVLVLFVAFFDGEKIKAQLIGVVLTCPTVQPVLDLRLLGQQVRDEVQNTQEEAVEEATVNEARIVENSPQVSEGYNIKPEPDKSPALVPAVGKSKKKLGKRNTNEGSEYTETPQKVSEVFKYKTNGSAEKKDKEDEKKSSHYNKENKKTMSCKRLNRLLVEEETSSTTTESSTNTDEVLESKENRCVRDNANKLKFENATNSEEGPREPRIAQNKVDRRRASKNPLKTKEHLDNSRNQQCESRSRNETKKRQSKEQKEKISVCSRKSSSEKSQTKPIDVQNVSSATLVSPKVWTENRATFSDVVARSECQPASSRPTNVTPSKPTMYVEPYKQTSTPLGPIGSRPVDFWQSGEAAAQSPLRDSGVNSFFSNVPNTENRNTATGDVTRCGDWATFQDTEKYFRYDPPRSNNNSIQSNSTALAQDYNVLDPWNRSVQNHWNSSNANPLRNSTIPFGTVSNQTASPNRQSSYPWDSSSVWQWNPWESPRSPTRTPPGFSSIHQNQTTNEEPQNTQRIGTYNPFTSGNIWPQNKNNIWKYSKDP